jgi:hypothetical protein
MCLIISKEDYYAGPKTAADDIIVYKFLENKLSGGLMTPYRCADVEIGETYSSELVRIHEFHTYDVTIGLHSFTSLMNVHAVIYGLGINYAIAECIIPKGAKYYEGHFDGYESIASDTIMYSKLVENVLHAKNIKI